jgi:uncharacterized repeat protein (TIGR01451 family)
MKIPLILARLCTSLVLAVVLVPDTGSGQTTVPAKVRDPVNSDIRVNGKTSLPIVAGKNTLQLQRNVLAQSRLAAKAVAALQSRVPGAEATISPITGSVEVVRGNRPLTSVAPGKSGFEIVRTFVEENAALYGLSGPEIAELHFIGESVSQGSGLRMVRVEQMVNGRPVFQSETRFTLDREGRLIRSVGLMIPKATESALPLAGLIAAPKALESAMASVNIAADASAMTLANSNAEGTKVEVVATQAEINGRVASEIVYFPVAPGVLVPAWSQVTFTSGHADWYTLVDARTGTLLWRKNIRAHASTQEARFRVYVQADGKTPADSPAPQSPTTAAPGGGTQFPALAPIIVNMLTVQDPTASPDGWISDNGTTTQGNNVHAYLDRANPSNVPDTDAASVLDGNGKPIGNPDTNGRNRDFLGTAPRDFQGGFLPPPQGGNAEAGQTATGSGSNGTLPIDSFRRGSVTHLFYIANWYHDQLYHLGFDEAAGNFQLSNFGRGGSGNDNVLAECQDATDVNNANFSTPPDGQSGRMQMYRFTGPTIDRDGSLDAEIVMHELTHGLSNRLIGNGSGLVWSPGGGMGEGWSDFYALSLLNNTNADDPNGEYVEGGYATYKLISGYTDNYVYGIRRFPYSTNNSINPLTWADVDDTTNNLNGGIASSPIDFNGNGGFEVHNIGEIWALSLWEVRSRVIGDPNGANGDVPTGNQTMLQMVTDAMKMTPINPSFTDARDALFDADAATNNNANEESIWAGFADRGLGYNAVAPLAQVGNFNFGHMSVGESSSLPYLDVQSVAIDDSFGNNNGFVDPGEPIKLTVTLKNPWRNSAKNVLSATATLASSTAGIVIVDNNSTYPAIPAQGSAAGDSFLITVPVTATAGQALKFTITITSSLGTKAVDFTLRVGTPGGAGSPITYTGTIAGGLAIPDATRRGVMDTLTVTDDLEIADLNFRVDNLQHTFTGDLTVLLRAPSGYGADLIWLREALFSGGGDGDNFINTVIDDQATQDLNQSTSDQAPFTGSWLPAFNSPVWNLFGDPIIFPDPVGQLGRLNGTSTKGDWKVLVADNFSVDTGTLNSWSLIVTPRAFSVQPFTPTNNVSGTQTVSGNFGAGGTVTYTVTLTNSGTAIQADNAGHEFSETLPAQLTLVNVAATSGAAMSGNTATWDGALAPLGGSITITITATINAGTDGQTVSAQGTIAYDADVNGTNEATAMTDDPGTAGASDPTSFLVLIKNPIVVNTGDDGVGSLRYSVTYAAPGSTVTFAPAVTSGGPATITLTTGQVVVGRNMTIAGPGADKLTVSGGDSVRVLSISPGTTASIAEMTIADGNAGGSVGGGIYNDHATLSVVGCTLSSNAGFDGGAIYNDGSGSSASLIIRDSTIAENSCPGWGGGIYNLSGTVTIINSTLSQNASGLRGGGIFSDASSSLSMAHSTLSQNTASNGGGIYNEGTLTIGHTLLAKGATGENCTTGASVTNHGYNLSDDSSCTFFGATDIVTADARLGALADNGGPTETIGLLPGSPAIDKGDPNFDPTSFTPSLDNDQRGAGFPRQADGGSGTARIDIGAFEVHVPPAQDDVVFSRGRKAFDIDVLSNDAPAAGATILIVNPPAHGTATVIGGKVHYDPDGPLPPTGDKFTYSYNGSTATVTIFNFTEIAVSYDGLVLANGANTGAERHEQSGYLRVTLTKTGRFSGVLTFAGSKFRTFVRMGFHGFSVDGEGVRIFLRRPHALIELTLQIETKTNTITGTAKSTDSAGHEFTSALTLEAQTPAGELAGQYTMLVQPDATPGSPQGTGFAAVTIKPTGAISVAGELADGVSFASGAYLHPDRSFPICARLYLGDFAAHGSLRGTIQFPAQRRLAGDASGLLEWFKPARSTDGFFPDELDLSRSAILARYESPDARARVLAFDPVVGNGHVVLDHGGIPMIDQAFTLLPGNHASAVSPNASRLTLDFDLRNGLFHGRFDNPVNGAPTPFRGAVFQAGVSGSGFFLGAGPKDGGAVKLGEK